MAVAARRFGGPVTGLRVRDVLGDVRRQASQGPEEHRSMLEYATLIPEANTGPLKLSLFPFQREPFYSDVIADSEEVVVMKSTQVGACLSPETRILTADLRWVPLEEVEPGDEIVATDEHPPGGRGRGRQMRRAVVEAKWATRRPAFRLTFDNGVTLVASGEHRFLWRAGWDKGDLAVRWQEVGKMKAGQAIRRVTDPWGASSFEDGWLGGIIDGEGFLRKRTYGERAHGDSELAITQQYGPVQARIAKALEAKGFHFREEESPRPNGRPSCSRLKIQRLDELFQVIGQTRSSRFADGDWWEDRGLPGKGAAGGSRPWSKIIEIEPLGERDLVDLQTSTGTYIAEGLVSHNSTGLWRWAVRLADQFGETVIYFFPTLDHVTDFGDERIEPSIEASEYLQRRMPRGGVRRKRLKEIGTGKLVLRGMNSKAGVQSIAGQAVVFDEYDECFVAGTLVLTKSGYRPIESIKEGDEILTHRGRWRPVEATGSRAVGRTYVLKAQGVPHLRGSAQHPIFARAFEGKSRFTVPPFRRRVYGEPKWVRLDELGTGKWKVAQQLPPIVPNQRSAKWWWFVGRYLADGCADGNSVHIEAAISEADIVEEKLMALFSNLKRKPYREAKAVRFTVSSRALCAELASFGRYAHGKRLTGEALSLSKEKAAALLDGYLSGDGHEDGRGYWSASSVSRELALGLALLVERAHGLVAGVCACAEPPNQLPASLGGRAVNVRVPYRLSFAPSNHEAESRDGLLWKKTRGVEEAEGAVVYNIAVAEDESFVAEGCVVHNSDPLNIAQAERRISGARAAGFIPRIRRVGRPSIPGYGIDAAFQESDRRQWMVTCPECGDEQHLTFAENMRWRSEAGGDQELRAGHDDFETRKDVSEAWRVCRSCNASLEHGPILKGHWKPTAHGPGRMPGFHIPRFIVQGTDLVQIVRASRSTKLGEVEAFHNADCGIAWAAADARLTDDDLARAAAAGQPEQSRYTGRYPVTLGLDVASERNLSCRISEHLPNSTRRALRIWEPEDFNEVERAMVDFRVHVAVLDSMPERRSCRALQAAFPGRVFLAAYDEKPNADAWRYDDKKQIIHVNRTEGIDAMMDAIRSATSIPTVPPPKGYNEQMKSPVRRIVEDTKGRPRRVYVSTGQQGDDYAHAEVYDLVASEMLHVLTMTQEEHEAGEPQIMDAPEPVSLGWGNSKYRPGFGGS